MLNKNQLLIGEAMQELVGAEIALKKAISVYLGTPVGKDLEMALMKLMDTQHMAAMAANRSVRDRNEK